MVVEAAFRLGNYLAPLGVFHDMIKYGALAQDMQPEIIAQPQIQALYKTFAKAADKWVSDHLLQLAEGEYPDRSDLAPLEQGSIPQCMDSRWGPDKHLWARQLPQGVSPEAAAYPRLWERMDTETVRQAIRQGCAYAVA